MKIVVWNCNMAFHEKWERLLSLQPDIAVIPECADVEVLTKKAPKFNPTSSLWIGDNRHKGLGVFTFGDFAAARATIYQPNFPYIAPVHIDGPIKFNLLAVWACHQRASYEASLGLLRRAINAYRAFLEVSLPKIPSGLESHGRAESSHHPERCLQSCTRSECL